MTLPNNYNGLVYCPTCEGEWSIYSSAADHDEMLDCVCGHQDSRHHTALAIAESDHDPCAGDGWYGIYTKGSCDCTGWRINNHRDDLQPAELTFSLDGHRGHYLSRDFTWEAADVLGIELPADDAAILDRYEDGADEPANMDEPNSGYMVYEAVVDIADEYEGKLSDAGYVVEWSDDVCVYKVLS